MFSDKTLQCRDCGTSFVFTASEQDFYAQKGFTNQPSRCPSCRAANKARRNATGGGSSYSTSGGYARPERQMFPAVCSNCGKATEVPFEPRLDKPVYCSDCFTPRERSSGGSSVRGGYGGGGSSYGDRDRGGSSRRGGRY